MTNRLPLDTQVEAFLYISEKGYSTRDLHAQFLF